MSPVNGSFSFIVAKRILCSLEENGSVKKTQLAVKSRLNYNTCVKYIEMLRLLGWVDVISDNSTYIAITKLGREVRERLLDERSSVFEPSGDQKVSEHLTSSIGVGNGSSGSNNVSPDKDLDEQPPVANQMVPASSKQDLVQYKKTEKRFKERIMLVDDEPDIILTYRAFLRDSGYYVEGFTDSYSALQKVASIDPSYFDLIILDIRMPGINGLQLYQSLKVMAPSTKFLFVTSLDAAQELVSVLPGVSQQQLLQKPLNKGYFVQRIKAILSG